VRNQTSLKGSVFNSEGSSSVIRKFYLRQEVCPVRSIVATKTSQKLLKPIVDALRSSIHLWVSVGRHDEPRSKASPKRLPKASDEFRVAVTTQHSGQSM
jgi:hypothetical protein